MQPGSLDTQAGLFHLATVSCFSYFHSFTFFFCLFSSTFSLAQSPPCFTGRDNLPEHRSQAWLLLHLREFWLSRKLVWWWVEGASQENWGRRILVWRKESLTWEAIHVCGCCVLVYLFTMLPWPLVTSSLPEAAPRQPTFSFLQRCPNEAGPAQPR